MKLNQHKRQTITLILYFLGVYGLRLTTQTLILSPILDKFLFYGRHIIFFLITICYFYRKEYSHLWKEFLSKFWKNIGQVFLSYIILLSVMLALAHLPLARESNSTTVLNHFNPKNIFEVLSHFMVVSIIGPMNEELVFCKILIPTQQTKLKRYFTVFASSLLFGLIHIFKLKDLPSIVIYFSAGLVLSIIYLIKKNIIFSSLAHILNNSLFTLINLKKL